MAAKFSRIAFLLLAVTAAGCGRAEAAATQRMIIPPGCYSLAPGDHYDVSAYCIDQSFAAPASGAVLGYAPASFGEAAVVIEGGIPLTLQAALEQHLIAIEGLGDHLRVRLKNLTAQKLQICIRAPTVVMGNGDYYSGDLPQIYDAIAKMLTPTKEVDPSAASTEDDNAAHDKLQRRLWAVVKAAEEKIDAESRSRNGAAAIYPKPPATLPPVLADPSKCAAQTNGVTVCQGK
jgi:hypothetical protein